MVQAPAGMEIIGVMRTDTGLVRTLNEDSVAWVTPRDDDALLIAHRGVIRAIVRKLTNQEAVVELGSIHILRFDDGWHAEMLDLIDHLEDT